ncbi:hypothetical protein [Fibrobacter sp. UWB11]|uniref:hypothetical protein n=1 Tax=Fibrobacter sp. UWB11 TaxID=1896202 RepID=UPI00092C0691|nr:hypothetical protein [Fibrobacter sp. UWB11]SIO45223.1 hypothetical protein SAMN05720758_3008 [Fibrobacter sp. UWB11]
MKRKISRWSCGIAVASLAALALVACDNETLAGPSFNSTNSSLAESSSSEIVARPTCDALSPECGYTVEELCRMGETRFCGNSSSSSVIPLSSQCAALLPECGYTVEQLCEMGITYYCANSSSSVQHPSSSSSVETCPIGTHRTSTCRGKDFYVPVCCEDEDDPIETCQHVSDVKCEACLPGEKCICHPCNERLESESRDCSTGKELYCKDGEWKTSTEICPNGRWTTSCGDKEFHEPVCCTEEMRGTCKHISDYDGMTAQGDCVNQNGSSAVDCVTGDNYQCRNNNWEKVACLNIKPDECKPGMGGCGYRLCEPNGIKEIADCESGAIYYCDGEKWEVKETENNQRCARGELEYCEACYREGEFEGHYKCENGKWKEYGLGDEICVHVSKLKCKLGMVGCGSCDPIYEGTIAEDCETGYPYQCHNGFWSEISVLPRCDALSPECGYSEYELCSKYGLKEYCNDKWLSEPCDGSESSRDLRIYANDDLYRSENYICVNGKWVERYRFYECAEELECDNPSIRCQSSPHIGTACDGDGTTKGIDGCVLYCSNGAYLYAPPPM